MNNQWNERYAGEDFFYGMEPNEFFKEQISKLNIGNLCLPMEGEGRNAIFAAKQGWEVMAYDFSEVAQQKALRFAQNNGVNISYLLSDNESLKLPEYQFDALALIFTHIPIGQRNLIYSKWLNSIKEGGHLIMEVYSKEQIEYATGGPTNLDLLYSVDEIKELLSNFAEINIEAKEVYINEGIGHVGISSVIRVLAVK